MQKLVGGDYFIPTLSRDNKKRDFMNKWSHLYGEYSI